MSGEHILGFKEINMASKLYAIKFKIKGRGNKIFKWERFSTNSKTARSNVRIVLEREYNGKAKIISVKLVR